MENNYNTPFADAVLKSLGWNKPFADTPIFVKDNDDVRSKVYPFIITFPVDFYGQYGMYEKLINEEHPINYKEALENIIVTWAKTYVTSDLYDSYLLLLATDFYHHQLDKDKAAEWKLKYEQATGEKY
jgi:hypothetical protein